MKQHVSDKVRELFEALRKAPLSPERYKLLELLIKAYSLPVPDLKEDFDKAVAYAIKNDEDEVARLHVEQLLRFVKDTPKGSEKFVLPVHLLSNPIQDDDMQSDLQNDF